MRTRRCELVQGARAKVRQNLRTTKRGSSGQTRPIFDTKHKIKIVSYLVRLQFFKEAALHLDHGLDPAPEGQAGVHDVLLGQGPPGSDDGGLEGRDIVVGALTGPGLQDAPHAVVERIQIWT